MRHKDCGVIGWDDEKIRKMLRECAPDRAEEIDKMTFGKFKEFVKYIPLLIDIRTDLALLIH